MRRTRTLGIALCAVILAAGLAGCDARSEATSRLHDEIPGIVQSEQFVGTADFRALAEPSEELRNRYAKNSMVYRVMEASKDRARVAFWRVNAPRDRAIEDFSEFTGSACVSIERRDSRVTSELIPCSPDISTIAPHPDALNWGPDAESIELARIDAYLLSENVRYLMSHTAGGEYRRDEPVTVSDVIDVIKKTNLDGQDDRSTVKLGAVVQHDGHVKTVLTITTTRPAATDTKHSGRAKLCFAMDVDLAARASNNYFNWLPLTEIRCSP